MKFKFTIGLKLLLAVILLALSAYFGLRNGDSSWHSQFAGDKVFPNLQLASVAAMSISAGGEHVTFENASGVWRIKERDGHPADFVGIAKTLSSLVSMKSALTLDEISARELKDFGLDSSHPAGPTLHLYDAAGKQLATLVLGRAHYRGGVAPSSPQERPDGRYCLASVPSGKAVPFLSNSLFEWLEPIPGYWLEPPSFDMTKTLSVSVQGLKAGSWSASRRTPSEPFAFDAPLKGAPDPKALSAVLTTLYRPQLFDLLSGEPPSLEETFSATVVLEGGASFDFTFGLGGGRAIMKVAKGGKPSKWTYELNPASVRQLLQTP